MTGKAVQALEAAIGRVVADFQRNPLRSWNERDLHWSLFHYIKQERSVPEEYVTQLIRAELPTLKVFGSARGYYDLVIIDPESYADEAVQVMTMNTPWGPFLERIRLVAAVEVKLWLARVKVERADWDVKKLTESPHNILNAYFLNFVQLDFGRDHNVRYYCHLREYLLQHKRNHRELKILCVPSNVSVPSDSDDNWLPA
jgi:hypothetical protein